MRRRQGHQIGFRTCVGAQPAELYSGASAPYRWVDEIRPAALVSIAGKVGTRGSTVVSPQPVLLQLWPPGNHADSVSAVRGGQPRIPSRAGKGHTPRRPEPIIWPTIRAKERSAIPTDSATYATCPQSATGREDPLRVPAPPLQLVESRSSPRHRHRKYREEVPGGGGIP